MEMMVFRFGFEDNSGQEVGTDSPHGWHKSMPRNIRKQRGGDGNKRRIWFGWSTE